MGIRRGEITTDIIRNGLVFNFDAANRSCYPKTGTTATDTVSNVNGTISGATFINTDVKTFDFDGTDDSINFGDSDLFSFGNGSVDSPFSISSWWNMDNYVSFRAIQKIEANYGEYRINTLNSGLFKFTLYDNGTGNYIGLVSDSNFSSYQDNWINVVCTYDGSSAASGCIAYVNGSVLATSTNVAGSYTAMHNLSAEFNIGQSAFTGVSTDANGQIANTQIYNRALSAEEVLHNYNGLKGRFGLWEWVLLLRILLGMG